MGAKSLAIQGFLLPTIILLNPKEGKYICIHIDMYRAIRGIGVKNGGKLVSPYHEKENPLVGQGAEVTGTPENDLAATW